MDFYNDALKEAEKQNIKLNEECKEIFMDISLQIQNLSLKQKKIYLEDLIKELNKQWDY